MGTDVLTTSFQFQVQYLHILTTIGVLFKYVNFLNLHQWILGMEALWNCFSYLPLHSISKFSSEVVGVIFLLFFFLFACFCFFVHHSAWILRS